MLVQVVPEVASELEPLAQAVADVYRYVQGELDLPDSSLGGIVNTAQFNSQRLIASLREEENTKFDARRRLSVERSIRTSLPPLSATLYQIELLVDATSYTPVPMSVGELLSSAPDTGSNRPKRVVSLSGDVDELIVSIPARIGIRCLSIVAEALAASGRPCAVLQAQLQDGRVELYYSAHLPLDGAASGRTAEIPICPHAKYNLDAALAALGRFDCSLMPDNAGISLPELRAWRRSEL